MVSGGRSIWENWSRANKAREGYYLRRCMRGGKERIKDLTMITIGSMSFHIEESILLPITLPLIIGTAILLRFYKNEENLLIGIFIIKPIVDYLLLFTTTIVLYLTLGNIQDWPATLKTVLKVIYFISYPILTATITFYKFRRMFQSYRIFWLILGLDFFRQIFLIFVLLNENTKYSNHLEEIWRISPSIYAIFVLLVFIIRNNNLRQMD
jgi:hypothetical protein